MVGAHGVVVPQVLDKLALFVISDHFANPLHRCLNCSLVGNQKNVSEFILISCSSAAPFPPSVVLARAECPLALLCSVPLVQVHSLG